jgi:hypothetical protein
METMPRLRICAHLSMAIYMDKIEKYIYPCIEILENTNFLSLMVVE